MVIKVLIYGIVSVLTWKFVTHIDKIQREYYKGGKL